MAVIQMYPLELAWVNAKLRERSTGDNSFIGSFCEACLRADEENYELMRTIVWRLMRKYPARADLLAAEQQDIEQALVDGAASMDPDAGGEG